jgi:hypothetical protein
MPSADEILRVIADPCSSESDPTTGRNSMKAKKAFAAFALAGAIGTGVLAPTVASANPNGPNNGNGTIVSNYGQCVRPQDIFVPRGGVIDPNDRQFHPATGLYHNGESTLQLHVPNGQGLPPLQIGCFMLDKNNIPIEP